MNKKPGALQRSLIIVTLLLTGLFMISCNNNSTTAEKEEGAANTANTAKVTEETHDLDVIIIDNPIYEEDRKSPSRFEHRKHAKDYAITCWECHHDYKDGENVWSPWGETQGCAGCHDPNDKIGNMVKLQAAYHLNCKKCHEERKIFGDDRLAYSRCNTCHE